MCSADGAPIVDTIHTSLESVLRQNGVVSYSVAEPGTRRKHAAVSYYKGLKAFHQESRTTPQLVSCYRPALVDPVVCRDRTRGESLVQRSPSAERRREELLSTSSGVSTSPCRAHNRAIMAATSVTEKLNVFEQYESAFDGCNFATSISRIAKLGGHCDQERLARLRAAILSRLKTFAMRHLSSVAWSVGKLNLRDDTLLEAICDLITSRFREMSPKDLGIVTWGLATARFRHAPCLSAVASVAVEHRDLLEPVELSNLVWGFATLQFRQGEMMGKLANICTATAASYNAKEFASVLWSY